MTDPLISKAEQHDYRRLFLIQDLHWSAPDHTPIDYSAMRSPDLNLRRSSTGRSRRPRRTGW